MGLKKITVWIWVRGRIYTLRFAYPGILPQPLARSACLQVIAEAAREDVCIPFGVLPIRAQEITAIYFEG